MTNIFLLLDLFSAIFNFSLGYYVFLKDYKRTANRVFFLLTLAATLWAASSAAFRVLGIQMGQLIVEIELEKNLIAWAWNQVGWIGIAFLPSILLHLSVIITSPKRIFKEKKFLASIYFISFIFLLWTFFGEPITYLIFYTLFTLFLISCFLFSFILLFKNYFSLKSFQEKAKLRYFLIGLLIPGIGGTALDIIFPMVRYGQFVGTTFSLYLFSFGYLFIAISVLKYGLFIDYREILETIFKRLSELVVITDKDGIIILTNEITPRKLNFKEEEIIGKNIKELLEKKEKDFKRIKEGLEKEGIFRERISFLTKGKREIPHLLVASLTKEGIIFVGRDIEELVKYQQRLEEEVKGRTEELEKARGILEIKVKARTRELEELAQSLAVKVKERTTELQKRIDELEKFHKLTIGRELKMVELKREIEGLKEEIEKEKSKNE
jgi:PAS domain S-box-containing protein